MGQLIDIASHRAKFTACELRMMVIDAWMMWSKGATVVPTEQSKWNKQESDAAVKAKRKADNEKVMREYKIK